MKTQKEKAKLKKTIRQMQNELDHYNPPKAIANAMMKLAQIGYEFSGHGFSFRDGCEDFGIVKNFGKAYIYVCFQSGDKCKASFNFNDFNENEGEEDHADGYSGSPGIIARHLLKIKTEKQFKEFLAQYV